MIKCKNYGLFLFISNMYQLLLVKIWNITLFSINYFLHHIQCISLVRPLLLQWWSFELPLWFEQQGIAATFSSYTSSCHMKLLEGDWSASEFILGRIPCTAECDVIRTSISSITHPVDRRERQAFNQNGSPHFDPSIKMITNLQVISQRINYTEHTTSPVHWKWLRFKV